MNFYFIEPYSCYQTDKKKKHPMQVLEEEQLYYKMLLEAQQNAQNAQVVTNANPTVAGRPYKPLPISLWNYDEPTIVINADGSRTITFKSVVNKNQWFEKNSNFPNGSWTTVSSVYLGDGTNITYTDTDTTISASAYRINLGDNIYTAYVGFLNKQFMGDPSGSDTQFSIPYTRPSRYIDSIQSVSESMMWFENLNTMQTNELVYASGSQTNSYYVHVRTGNKSGYTFDVVANSANSLQVSFRNSESFSGMSKGDIVAIVPHWTLNTVFPSASGIVKSLNSVSHKSELLTFNYTASGINQSSNYTFYYLSGSDRWQRVGDATNQGDVILDESLYFLLRQKTAGVNSTASFYGRIHMEDWRVPIIITSGSQQDNILSIPRASALSFNNLGLVQQGLFNASPDLSNPVDSFLLYSSNTGQNVPLNAYYYTTSSMLVKSGSDYSYNYINDLILTPSDGFRIRKAAGSNTVVYPLINHPPYTF